MTGATRPSDAGLIFTASHEGIVPARYHDSVGVDTWGIGHTKAAGVPDPEDMSYLMPIGLALDTDIAAAFWTFMKDAERYARDIVRHIAAPLSQSQFDAIFDWHYNTGRVGRSTLTDLVNKGDMKAASYEFAKWNKPPMPQRRHDEAEMFRNGRYPDKPVTVWRTNGSGRVLWKPIKTISRSDALAQVRTARTRLTPPKFRKA